MCIYRRGAARARSSRSNYTYRPFVRLNNPLQTINKKKKKTIFVIDTPVEHVKNILTSLINLIKGLKCRVYHTHNLTYQIRYRVRKRYDVSDHVELKLNANFHDIFTCAAANLSTRLD